jgi:DNA polymerase III gamma/tau subunit
LKRVVKGEKLKVEKGVLEEIAQSSDGSFRDAQKNLDQLAMANKKITLEETKQFLGRIEAMAPDKLLSLLAERKLKGALLEIDRIISLGADLSQYCQDVLDKLRMGLLSRAGLTEISCPQEVAGFEIFELTQLIRLFSQAASDLKTSPIPQLPLELAVVEWLKEERLIEPSGKKKKETREKQPLPTGKTSPQDGQLFREIKERWSEVMAGVRPLNHSVEALLRASRPAGFQKDVLTLEVFYKFHKERLETDKCRSVVEEVTSEVINRPVKLRCVLGQKRETVKTEEKEPDVVQAAEDIFGIKTN